MRREASNPVENVDRVDRIRVLVVESDARLRALLCSVLDHDQRFDVVGQASSEEEAVTSAARFDVALVDLRLSGLGGMGTLGRLTLRDPVPAVVVLAETGAIYLRHAAAEEGAVGYLVRPDDLKHLGDRLAELLASSPAMPAPTGSR
jgi:DNA-binding NarL/FixJ family response regulator